LSHPIFIDITASIGNYDNIGLNTMYIQ